MRVAVEQSTSSAPSSCSCSQLAGGPGVATPPGGELALVVGLAEDLLRLGVAEEDEHLVIAGEGHASSMALLPVNNQS